MKRIFAFGLVLAMILSMSVTAFAAEGSGTGKKPGESQNIDVTAKTESNISAATVYSVDIEWESMTFTYVESGSKVWNPNTHAYSTSTESKWDRTESKITVTNHSNASVKVAVEYTPIEGNGVSGTISNGSATLNAGVENKPKEADKLEARLTISGTPNESVTDKGIKVGSVKVTISN